MSDVVKANFGGFLQFEDVFPDSVARHPGVMSRSAKFLVVVSSRCTGLAATIRLVADLTGVFAVHGLFLIVGACGGVSRIR